jgi:hypothetical protein
MRMRQAVAKTKVNLAVISQNKSYYGLPTARIEGLINVLENTLEWLLQEKDNITINDIILSWSDDLQEWSVKVTFYDLRQVR